MTGDESPPDLFMPKPPSPLIDLIRNPGDFNPSDAEVAFVQSTKKHKNMKNHLNPFMLVFIGKMLLSAMR